MKKARIYTLLLASCLCATLLSSCNGKGESSSSEEYHGTDPSTILDGYYSELSSWDNYIDLKHKLYNIIRKNYTPISYTQDPEDKSKANWSTNRNADQSLTNFDKVHLLYSDDEEFKQTGTTSNWQREHCFPASLMTGLATGEAVKTIGTATDFHNLLASYSNGNSAHSNMSFGYIVEGSGEVLTVGNARYQEDDASTPDINEGVFEPADIDKGRTARAVMYMAVMYGNDSWVENTDGNGHELSVGLKLIRKGQGQCTLHQSASGNKCHSNLDDLVDWNSKFWPDRLEYQHNTYVQGLQNNRNPFADFPELADYVFGEKRTEPGKLENLHNIYDILNLGSSDIANISIKNVKYNYDGGDIFEKESAFEVYETTNSFTTTKCEDYEVSGINIDEPLSSTDNGKTITISKGEAKASYKVYIASEEWNNVNYTILPTSTSLKGFKAGEDASITGRGITWNFSTTGAKTVSALDLNCQDIGVGIGSSSSPAGTLTIESADTICFDGDYVVKKIFIEANSANKWNGGFDLEIRLDNSVVYSDSVSYTSIADLKTSGISLSPLKQSTGKVKITFSGVNTKLNLGRIGLLVSKSSD